MDAHTLMYKMGQFNMSANLLRQLLREIDCTHDEAFGAVFEILDRLCDNSELCSL